MGGMDRLTVYIDGEAREDHSRDTGKWKNGSRECMARLAAYEDTGLMPEDIIRIRAELEAALEKLQENKLLLEAGEMDMENPLERIKVQAALRSEMMKLKFRQEHDPKKISVLDYTIIYALKNVLDGGGCDDGL